MTDPSYVAYLSAVWMVFAAALILAGMLLLSWLLDTVDRALANRGRLRVARQLGITLRGDFQ